MKENDLEKLFLDTQAALLEGRRVAILGLTPTAAALLTRLAPSGLGQRVVAVYCDSPPGLESLAGVSLRALPALTPDRPDAIVVASDDDKESLILAALPHIIGAPKLIVAGYGNYRFRDELYEHILTQLLVPSMANGSPHTLVHLFQCLRNAARLGLRGAIAELGAFKGGTTMFLALATKRLGADWPVIGFDSFAGFPQRRSPLDMYDHPGCIFRGLDAVRSYVAGHNIELVPGDIVETCQRLSQENLVLSFIDTDNYSPAARALAIVRERTVLHGAIVFDHFAGVDRFRYTLGERLAALPLLEDRRFINLHGTGVFLRQV